MKILYYFCIVRRVLAILLMTLYLMGSTHFRQLIKLPLLVEHYLEHKQRDNEISIWTFLQIHYTDSIVFDEDFDKDMQLPFKSCDFNSNASIYYVCSSVFFQSFNTIPLIYKKQKFFISNTNTSSSYLSSIWQPPKAC